MAQPDDEQATAPAPAGRPYPPPGRAESMWPVHAAVFVAIALQLLLPTRVTAGPPWLLPAIEGALLAALVIALPNRVEAEDHRRRTMSMALTGLISAVNIASLVLLCNELLASSSPGGRALIAAGALIWLTNVLIFGLWYWETDRGGPGRRAAGHDAPPDLLFSQMNDDRIEPSNWRPRFIDYLYVSLTNATAFSPTDTMPLTPMAKSIMGLQSLVSLVTIGLVIARAVNVLH
jgi:uncharacterized membrane protein